MVGRWFRWALSSILLWTVVLRGWRNLAAVLALQALADNMRCILLCRYLTRWHST